MNMLSGCEHNSEQVAAEVLGYTKASWNNLSGKEPQPSSSNKYWSKLRHSERVAAVVLGYTGKVWDNESGSEPQPASADKLWNELSPCADEGEYSNILRLYALTILPVFLFATFLISCMLFCGASHLVHKTRSQCRDFALHINTWCTYLSGAHYRLSFSL